MKYLWPDQDLLRISVIAWSTISAATLRASNVSYATTDDEQINFERHNNTTGTAHNIIKRILETDLQFLRTQRETCEKMRQDYEKQLQSYRWQLNLAWHKDADLQEELRRAQSEIAKFQQEKELYDKKIEDLATCLHSKRRVSNGSRCHSQGLEYGDAVQVNENSHEYFFKILAEECSDNCPVRMFHRYLR